jgi:hypothetical protein
MVGCSQRCEADDIVASLQSAAVADAPLHLETPQGIDLHIDVLHPQGGRCGEGGLGKSVPGGGEGGPFLALGPGELIGIVVNAACEKTAVFAGGVE